MLKTDSFPERRTVDFTHSVDKGHLVKEDGDRLLQDTMTEHMQMLYAKYNQAGFPFKDGNTVRSFKAHWGKSPLIFLKMSRQSQTCQSRKCITQCLNFGKCHRLNLPTSRTYIFKFVRCLII